MTELMINKKIEMPLTNIKTYNNAIKAFNKKNIPVTPENIEMFLDQLRQDGKRPATINNYIKAFKKSLLNVLVMQGKDTSLDIRKLESFFKGKIIKVDISIDQESTLTQKEYEELLSITEKTDYKMFLFLSALYESACRVSELINIQLKDCKIKNDHVSINVIGKGNKERTVFITRKLFDNIVKHFNSSKYLFSNRKGTRFNRSNLFRDIQKAGQLIGIDNLHPHILRHTFATLNIDRLGLYTISKYLGHSDVGITAKIYVHKKATAKEILNLKGE